MVVLDNTGKYIHFTFAVFLGFERQGLLFLVKDDTLGGEAAFSLIEVDHHNGIVQIGAHHGGDLLAHLGLVDDFSPDGLEPLGMRDVRARDLELALHLHGVSFLVDARENGLV